MAPLVTRLNALQANLVIDANVFKACRENGVRCIIYASSVSVYPFEKQLGSGAIFKEDDATEHVNPEGGYGWSKFVGEIQLDMMPDVAVGVARIFHAYGENIYIKPDRSQVDFADYQSDTISERGIRRVGERSTAKMLRVH